MNSNGLEIATDLKHQRRLWIVERIGWTLMALIVVAALGGLFGNGPMSKARAGDTSLQLNYERFARYEAPTELRAHVGPELTQGKQLRLWISRDYLDHLEVERTMPPAVANDLAPGRVLYIFNLAQTNTPAQVTFYVRHTGFGKTTGRAGIIGGPEVQFSQFVYP